MTAQYIKKNSSVRPFSDTCYQFSLLANTIEIITIPGLSSQQYVAFFKFGPTASVWVGKNNPATVAAPGNPVAVNQIELLPDERYVRGGDVISFISEAVSTDISMSLLAQ
jgi:hypothetical protein